jgi:predicted alpha-1,2-mannosidase
MRPSDYVSTLAGTLSDYSFSAGNTYPATALPWGMNCWTPQTGRNGDGWTYRYDHHTIRGLKQTHQPSPWINDYGCFSLMPVNGRTKTGEDARASIFSHKSEIARPYYYNVYLADHDVLAELTPSERAAILRFTFPQSDSSAVVIDAYRGNSSIEILPERRTVVGYTTANHGGVPDNFRNWFVVQFDTPFADGQVWKEGGEIIPQTTVFTGNHAGAVIGFDTRRGQQVTARVASSFISLEQAYRNLEELGEDSFEQVKEKAQARWDEVLGRIRVEGGTDGQLRTFYSCLYRSLLFPRKFYEITSTGETVHYSPYNGEVLPGYMYTDTGFWDTFRSLFPLLNLVYPSVSAEIQQGLANAARESGFLPEWASPGHRDCMVGNNSASVVADAILKGIPIPQEDIEILYRTLLTATDSVHPAVRSTGRLGHEYYNTLGYVPCDVGIRENVARTLEYAYDDWCIYQAGKALGKPADEIAVYGERAGNYRRVFDPSRGVMRGRKADGAWSEPFDPYKWGGDFTEGNSWHYTWSVFHDPGGLAELMGGRERFAEMLDSVMVVPPVYDDSYYGFRIHEIAEMQVMNMGNYAHGNQPVQHMLYLYDWAGQPWKTQHWVREVMDRFYSSAPDGYCGDEDNGQTSAWYVFSALGFYPVCPGSGEYALGSPLFPKATVTLENGRRIGIEAAGNSPGAPYVKSLQIDGRTVSRNYLTHAEIASGAKLLFEMTSEPDTARGTATADSPYSFSAK